MEFDPDDDTLTVFGLWSDDFEVSVLSVDSDDALSASWSVVGLGVVTGMLVMSPGTACFCAVSAFTTSSS